MAIFLKKNPILIGLVGFKGLLKMKTTMVADVYYETSLGDNITDKKGHFEKDGEPVAISFFWQGSQEENMERGQKRICVPQSFLSL